MQKKLLLAVLVAASVPTYSQIKINEFMTGGKTDAKEEFVELYNSSDTSINLLGWKLLYKTSSGKTETELLTFTEEDVLLPKEYFVAGSDEFPGKNNGKLKGNLSGTSGSIGLKDDEGVLVESVAYGKVSPENDFIEKSPCAAPGKGISMSRIPDGSDTDDNSIDFVKSNAVTPGESNKPLISSTFDIDRTDEIEFLHFNETRFAINFKTPSIHNEVVIFDSSGKQLFSIQKNSLELDLSSYLSGVYFINLVTEERKVIKKVIVK